MLPVLLFVPLLAVYVGAVQIALGFKYSQKFQSLLSGEKADNPFDKSFDKFVHETLSTWHIPGVAIAVIKAGVTYTKVSSVYSIGGSIDVIADVDIRAMALQHSQIKKSPQRHSSPPAAQQKVILPPRSLSSSMMIKISRKYNGRHR